MEPDPSTAPEAANAGERRPLATNKSREAEERPGEASRPHGTSWPQRGGMRRGLGAMNVTVTLRGVEVSPRAIFIFPTPGTKFQSDLVIGGGV